MAKRFPITKAQFAKYLRKRNLPKFIAGDTDNCPLAKAVKEATGNPKHGIGASFHYPTGSFYEGEPLPKWAKKFVDKYDSADGKVSPRTIIKKL
jgi:hypothetical protein